MDIARIRKKLKKRLETPDKQKIEEEKLARGTGPDSQTQKVPKAADTESNISQSEIRSEEEIEKAEEAGKTGLPKAGIEEETVQEETEILTFRIANEEYAVRIIELQEVLKDQKITAVPRAPSYLRGITSLRGKILPVIDLKARLGLTDENGGRQKIIVLSGKKEPLGALVGAVLGVFRFPASKLLPPPSTLTEEEKNFIEGVVKINNKFIPILKVNELLKMEAL